eukprot:365645-Chlamydomonas_euryale.AAC.4
MPGAGAHIIGAQMNMIGVWPRPLPLAMHVCTDATIHQFIRCLSIVPPPSIARPHLVWHDVRVPQPTEHLALDHGGGFVGAGLIKRHPLQHILHAVLLAPDLRWGPRLAVGVTGAARVGRAGSARAAAAPAARAFRRGRRRRMRSVAMPAGQWTLCLHDHSVPFFLIQAGPAPCKLGPSLCAATIQRQSRPACHARRLAASIASRLPV